MAENLSPPEVRPPEASPTGPGELKSTPPGRAGKPSLSCSKCGKVYHKQAGIRARERHEVDCKGPATEQNVLFEAPEPTKKKEVKRPPKGTLYSCTGCQARFYSGTVYCPGCGEEIEW